MQALAIASVPMQKYRLLYPQQLALWHGTLFLELEKPLACKKGGAADDPNGADAGTGSLSG